MGAVTIELDFVDPVVAVGGDLSLEQDNFYPCPICGQMVDMRDLRQVIWHEQPKHKPLGPSLVSSFLASPP